MDYLQEAKEHAERSFGDVRNAEHKQRLTQIAMMYAAIAQAEAAVKQANALGRLANMQEVRMEAEFGEPARWRDDDTQDEGPDF